MQVAVIGIVSRLCKDLLLEYRDQHILIHGCERFLHALDILCRIERLCQRADLFLAHIRDLCADGICGDLGFHHAGIELQQRIVIEPCKHRRIRIGAGLLCKHHHQRALSLFGRRERLCIIERDILQHGRRNGCDKILIVHIIERIGDIFRGDRIAVEICEEPLKLCEFCLAHVVEIGVNIVDRHIIVLLKFIAGEDVNLRFILLLLHDFGIRDLIEQMIDQLLCIADRSGHQRAGRGTFLLADDTGDMHRNAVLNLLRHVFIIAAAVLPAVFGLIEFIEICLQDDAELHVHQIFIIIAFRLYLDLIARHDIREHAGDFIRIAQAETVERHAGDLIVIIDNENDLIHILRPMTADYIILLIEQLLVAVEQRPDIHAVGAHGHDLRIGRGHRIHVVAEHTVIGIDQRIRVDRRDPVGRIREIDKRLNVVVVFDVIGFQAVLVVLDILFEADHIILLDLGDHCIEHFCFLTGRIDLIQRMIVVMLRLTGDVFDDARKVNGLCKDCQRIRGKRILLHLVDIGLEAVREREDQRNTDDADTAGEGSQQRAAFFRQQIVQRERECRRGTHRDFLLFLFAVILLICGLFFCKVTGAFRDRLLFVIGLCIALDLTVQQADDARCILLGKIGVVCDHNDKAIFRNLLEQIHDLHARFGIERTGRLIGQQDFRIVDQRTRDRDTLHLTAGHLIRLFVDLIAESHALKHFLCTFAALGFGDARKRQRELNIGEHRLMRDQIVGLKDKADRVIAVVIPVSVLILFGRFVGDGQIALCVAVQSADDVQQRCFAAAGRSEHRDKFILPELDVNALECLNL